MKYFIILLVSSLYLNSCIREECQFNGQYEFEVPATLSPARDTFHIGDTISIVSSFGDMVYERKTDMVYKLENFRFYPSTAMKKIDSSSTVTNVTNYFELLIGESQNYHFIEYSNGDQGVFGQYLYSDNKYSLEFKLIAKSTGLFYMEQGVNPFIIPDQEFEGKCNNKGVDGAVKLNGGTDNNIDMLHDSPDPHYNTWILIKPEERFHKFGGYCFYVKG